jgi:hypothetical protein
VENWLEAERTLWQPNKDEIEVLAYQLWQKNPSKPAIDIWLEAERTLQQTDVLRVTCLRCCFVDRGNKVYQTVIVPETSTFKAAVAQFLTWKHESRVCTTTFGALPLHIKQPLIRDLVNEYADKMPILFARCIAGTCL